MGIALSSALRLERIPVMLALCACTALSACGMGETPRPSADVGSSTVADYASQSPQIAADPLVVAEPTPSVVDDAGQSSETAQIADIPQAEQPAEPETPSLARAEEEEAQTYQSSPDEYGFPASVPDPVARGQAAYALSGSEAACRTQLKRLGVVFSEGEPINDGGVCRIDHPLKVSGFASGNIKLKPAATLNCQMTLAFARWVKSDLTPSTRLRYLSGINTIHQASSYSCRTMSNQRGRAMSEHSRGNALDISRITLNNGKAIKVQKPGLFSFRQRGLLNSVRSDACDYFTTVLGPGYDRFHGDHFHFDLMQRRNGRRACR